jgi:hypothetical protein
MSCVLWHLKQSVQCHTRARLAFVATGCCASGVAAELRSRLPRDGALAIGGSRTVAAHAAANTGSADVGGGGSGCAGGGGGSGGVAAVAVGCTSASPVSGAGGVGDGAAARVGSGGVVCGCAGDCES